MNPLRCKIAVDLAPLSGGGGNGGIKPLALEIIRGLRRASGGEALFYFLIRASVIPEIAKVAGEGDKIFVVEHDVRPKWWARLRARRHPPVVVCRGSRAEWSRRYFGDADVLYCPFGGVRRFGADFPTVALVADVLHRDFPGSLEPFEILRREGELRETLRLVGKVHCISEFAAARLRAIYGLESERIVVARAWIQGRLGDRPAPEGGQDPYFVYPANLWRHKNHETLLAAMAVYVAETERTGGRPWTLHLTGAPSPREAELREMVDRLGLRRSVIFHGHGSDAAFRRLLASASAVVFPSCYEGFGIPMAEAMEWGLPLVCADIPSAREVAGAAALYFPALDPWALAERMGEISGNETLRRDLAEKGRERVKSFSFDREMEVLWQALRAAA